MCVQSILHYKVFMDMQKKIIEIEFSGDNHLRISNIAWILLLIKKINTGYDEEFIREFLSKRGNTIESLNLAIESRNYDRNIIYEYGEENGVNPEWLVEYKEIVPEDYLHLL